MCILKNLQQLIKGELFSHNSRGDTIINIGRGNCGSCDGKNEQRRSITLDKRSEYLLNLFLKGGRGLRALDEKGSTFQITIYGICGEDVVSLTEQADFTCVGNLLAYSLIREEQRRDGEIEFVITEQGKQYLLD